VTCSCKRRRLKLTFSIKPRIVRDVPDINCIICKITAYVQENVVRYSEIDRVFIGTQIGLHISGGCAMSRISAMYIVRPCITLLWYRKVTGLTLLHIIGFVNVEVVTFCNYQFIMLFDRYNITIDEVYKTKCHYDYEISMMLQTKKAQALWLNVILW